MHDHGHLGAVDAEVLGRPLGERVEVVEWYGKSVMGRFADGQQERLPVSDLQWPNGNPCQLCAPRPRDPDAEEAWADFVGLLCEGHTARSALAATADQLGLTALALQARLRPVAEQQGPDMMRLLRRAV